MASVAADTSAIAPPPPLPSRPDAAPSGPSSGFADMLDATAPASAPPPPSAARAGDCATPAQGGSASTGANSPAPAAAGAATPGPRGSKDAGNGKDTSDKRTSGDDSGAPVDLTIVAGVALPLAALVPMADANQTPGSSQNTQADSSDAAAPTHDSTDGAPTDRKDASAPSDPLLASLVAALPVAAATPNASATAVTAPGDSRPAAAAITGVASLAPGASEPAAVPDPAAVTTTLPDTTTQPRSAAPTETHDALPAVASAAALPPAGELQTDVVPTLPSLGETNPAPDQNVHAVPAVAPLITPSAPTSTAAAAAPLNPIAAVTAQAAGTQPTQEAANAPAPREAEAVTTALPAQIAVRFAVSSHGNNDAASDSGSDVLTGFAGATIGGAAPSSNGPPGAAILPSFNSLVSTLQTAPGPATAPQHGAVAPEAVPLAGIPIAIVTRAEAGERKFEIRLDPPDLGRIEVQLNVDSSGRATSHLVVDRADTLDLLRRDAPALERALQSAGLTTDDASLQFSLRDQSFAGRDQGSPAPVAPPAPAAVAEGDVAPIDAALRRYGPATGLGGGIDIRV